MKSTILAAVFAASLIPWIGASAEEAVAEKMELKNGGMLFMHPDGTSRMVDADGKPMDMADGMEMEEKGGRVMMMKNKKVWMRHGPPGKGQEGMMKDMELRT